MKNQLMLLLAFVAIFMFSAPVVAAPPEDTATEEKASVETTEGKPEEKAEAGDKEPAEVKTDEEAAGTANAFYLAIQEKHWALALGLGLTLLVFLLRKVKILSKVPAKAIPWVASALGILGYVAAALMSGDTNLVEALTGGLMAGATAVGLWEMLLKNVLGNKAEA